ncbi:MAG: hypothetical protein CMG58_00445 [Candidatus Marinimicrobia bacterium]|nr:hypothetical protein [Candidatus Neomarinimicrobiota bacterium]|tara:strand:+ start:1420 stop:2904 length:1485 start_codon:yes stop_codon:yes gene_type:complete
MIKKILIANRGEIAVRIIRTCREMGIKSIAVYSKADRVSLHVLLADEAYYIGPSQSIKSYLDVNKILEVIKKSNADAVHPGYGFLSENANFASTIKQNGIKWIGAPFEAITLMGDKMAARNVAKKYSIPLIPGTENPIKDLKSINEIAEKIGYPILLKSAGGGGGKGMRIVFSKEKLKAAFERATSESEKAFSDSRIYIEKYLEDPHHIEIQILSDTFDNHISLGERECSIQRRYQKIIEETPSPFIDDNLRNNLSKAAITLAKSCNYVGAGTVEFLVDKHKNWYFLEMNTRLQVEHPVTELVNGIDIVKEQIRIANKEKLTISQNDINPTGHAIECRIYAENGLKNFQPSIGKIMDYFPPSGPGVRMDEGFIRGQEITPYYDPMLGKLIVWGNSREEALARMNRALCEIKIVGPITSISVCKDIINHPSFKNGNYCTHTLDQILRDILKNQSSKIELSKTALILNQNYKKAGEIQPEKIKSNWLKSGLSESME